MFEKHGKLSVADFLKYKEKDEDLKKQFLPKVVPLIEGPPEAQLWILKAGITPEQAYDEFGIGWNEFTQRVILPMSDNPSEFIARSVLPKHNPKYVVSKGARGKFYYRRGTVENLVVVVEDMLSCIKINMAGYSSIAAMGTTFSLPLTHKAAQHGTVISWLDADKAGRTGNKKLRSGMALWDVNYHNVCTELDPKYNSIEEIHNLLKEYK